jgi:hypothetical protein
MVRLRSPGSPARAPSPYERQQFLAHHARRQGPHAVRSGKLLSHVVRALPPNRIIANEFDCRQTVLQMLYCESRPNLPNLGGWLNRSYTNPSH